MSNLKNYFLGVVFLSVYFVAHSQTTSQYALISNKEGQHHSGSIVLLDSNLSSDSLYYSFENYGKEAPWIDYTCNFQRFYAIGGLSNFVMEYDQGLNHPPISHNHSPYLFEDIIEEDSNYIYLYGHMDIVGFHKTNHQFQLLHQFSNLPVNTQIVKVVKDDQSNFYALAKDFNHYYWLNANLQTLDTLENDSFTIMGLDHQTGSKFIFIRKNNIYVYDAQTNTYSDSAVNVEFYYGHFDKDRNQYHYTYYDNDSTVLKSYDLTTDSTIVRAYISLYDYYYGTGGEDKFYNGRFCSTAGLTDPNTFDTYEGIFYYDFNNGNTFEDIQPLGSHMGGCFTSNPATYVRAFPTSQKVVNFPYGNSRLMNINGGNSFSRPFQTVVNLSAQTVDAAYINNHMYIQANNGSHEDPSTVYQFSFNQATPNIYPMTHKGFNLFEHQDTVYQSFGKAGEIYFDVLNTNSPTGWIDGKTMHQSGAKIDNHYVCITKDSNNINYLSSINLVTLEETSIALPFSNIGTPNHVDIVINQSKTSYYFGSRSNNSGVTSIFKFDLIDSTFTNFDVSVTGLDYIMDIQAGLNDEIYFTTAFGGDSNYGGIGRIDSLNQMAILHEFDSITWSSLFEFPLFLEPTQNGMMGATKDYVFEVTDNGLQIVKNYKEVTNLVLLDSTPITIIDTTMCYNSWLHGMYITIDGSYEFTFNGVMGHDEKYIYNISLEQYTPEILHTELANGDYQLYPSLTTTDIVWYQSCNFNTPFSTQDTITVQNGAYNYIASVGDIGCVDTSDCLHTVVLGLNEPADKLFSLYPNPASQELNISVLENSKFEMVDMQGKVVRTVELKAGDNLLDISGLKSGIYFIKNITDRKTLPFKLVITN